MSRVTKQIAESVARQMTETHYEKIQSLKEEKSVFVTDLYRKKIPKEVFALYAKHPDYIDTEQSIQMVGPGLSYHYESLTERLPSSNRQLVLTEAQATSLVKMINDISDRKSKLRRLQNEIAGALFALKTYNNVKSAWPDAFLLLPAITANTALMVNLNDLRAQINAVRI